MYIWLFSLEDTAGLRFIEAQYSRTAAMTLCVPLGGKPETPETEDRDTRDKGHERSTIKFLQSMFWSLHNCLQFCFTGIPQWEGHASAIPATVPRTVSTWGFLRGMFSLNTCKTCFMQRKAAAIFPDLKCSLGETSLSNQNTSRTKREQR